MPVKDPTLENVIGIDLASPAVELTVNVVVEAAVTLNVVFVGIKLRFPRTLTVVEDGKFKIG